MMTEQKAEKTDCVGGSSAANTTTPPERFKSDLLNTIAKLGNKDFCYAPREQIEALFGVYDATKKGVEESTNPMLEAAGFMAFTLDLIEKLRGLLLR